MAKYKIIPSSRTIVQSPISIGHKAEKGVEAIEFDLTAWVETYGSGTLTVIMRRWGDAIPYPIALEIDENNKATWVLSDTDTARAGMAYAQLSYIVGDEVVKKSDIYTFRVMDSLTGEGEPPEAYESWLEHLTHLAAEAMAEVLDIEGVATDKTLTVDGGIADAKAVGEALAEKVDAADYSTLSNRVGANTIALAEKADRSTTYTKTEVDELIDEVEVETDTTLEVAGAAADAAETGRQIGLLKADLDSYHVTETVDGWENGSIGNDGAGSAVDGRIRTASTVSKATGCVGINVNTGYEFFVAAWDGEGAFVGVLRTDGTFKKSGTILYVTEFNLLSYADYSYKIVMRRTDSTNITLEESDNALFSYSIPQKNSDKIAKLDEGVNNIASNLGVETDLTPMVTLTNGKGVYYRYNGQFSNSTVSSYTSFVDISEYDKIRFTRKRLISSSSYGCAFYREAQNNLEGNLVKGYREPYGYPETSAETVEIDVPEGANYFRTTWFASTLDLYNQYDFSLIGIKTGTLEKRIEDTETDIETLKEACLPNIDDKYTEEMADTISKVRDLCTEPCLVFPWSTDNHILSANADNVQNYADMVRNVRVFAQSVPCDFVLDTGDLTDGNVAKATTLARAYEAIEKIRSVGVPFVWTQGNHDTNYASATFTMGECFKAYFTATGKSAALNQAENGTDYYIDFESIGVRLIVLNANNVTDYAEYAYGSTTATWLTSALDTQKDVIVAVHQSPITSQVYGNQSTRLATGIVTALTDFVENGGNLIMLSGHSHNDVAFVNPFVSIMQDCQRFNLVSTDVTDDAHDMTGFIDVVRKNARSASDHTTDLWSVVVYKALSKELDLIRFGAGKDRYFHTTPIEPTTVTSRLSDVTWSTSDATVATVSGGVITGVGSGRCAILAKDTDGNYECWIVVVN